VIYLPFVLSAVCVGLCGLVCRRTSPRSAAWSVTVAMVLLAGSTVGALGLLAWPLAARLPAVAHLGGWRPSAVSHGIPVPEVVSIVATMALAVVVALVVFQVNRLHRGLGDISRMHAGLTPTGATPVAVVDDHRPSAHALPATFTQRGVVVVSTGLLEVLDDEERAAVLAHEQAHLAHAHRLFVVVAGLAAAMNPILVSCRGDLAFALERWADEDAARQSGRTVTARALAKSALAKLSGINDRIAPALALELGRLGVPQRVAALLEPDDTRRRTVLAWLVAGVALVGIAAIVWATRDTEHLFELLQRR